MSMPQDMAGYCISATYQEVKNQSANSPKKSWPIWFVRPVSARSSG